MGLTGDNPGVGDVAGLSAEHTARTLLEVTTFAFLLSEVTIRVRSASRTQGARADRGSVLAVVVGLVAGLVVAVWTRSAVPGAGLPGGWATFVLGIALMWLGILLRQWSVWTLGRSFTVVVRVAEGQSVVSHGPYRWVRHPSYTGLMLTLVGLGVALGNWLSVLALLVLPLLGIIVRIRVEERALLDALGEPYQQYAASRRRLVPGVW